MKKKFLSILILTSLAVFLFSSCTVGVNRIENRDVGDFSALSINSFGEFIIRQGDSTSLTIDGPNNYLRYIETEVVGDTLYIDSGRGFLSGPLQKIVYTLTVEDLNEVVFSGAGSIRIYSLDTQDFEIVLTGAGSVDINSLNAQSFTALLNSAGSITVSGNVQEQDIILSGVGSYDARHLESKTASINLTGAGSADIWVTDSLDVNVSGVGSVDYYGNPSVEQTVSGLGSVNGRGER